jgi:hypothetical protein
MINQKDNFEAWVGLIDGLDEAKEHLASLMNQLHSAGQMDESEFAVHLGHVYAHLNRVWNRRNRASELTDQEWETFSAFPTDIRPVG